MQPAEHIKRIEELEKNLTEEIIAFLLEHRKENFDEDEDIPSYVNGMMARVTWILPASRYSV